MKEDKMGEITERLMNNLGCTDGTLENLFGGVESYIKRAGHSALSKNDRKLFMRYVLALIETAREKKREALKIVNKFPPSFPNALSGSLLDVIEDYIKQTERSSLTKEQQDKLLDYIISAVVAIIIIS